MDKIGKQKHNYVYLIREREFIRCNDPVYKLGKTTQLPNSRLSGYPKHSEVLLFIDVFDCHFTEKELMKYFDNLFICRRDIGREYYEGDLNFMKRTFFDVIGREFEVAHILTNNDSYAWRFLSSVKNYLF